MKIDELQLGSSSGEAFQFDSKASLANDESVHLGRGALTKPSDDVIQTSNLSDANSLLTRFHLADGVDSVLAIGCPFDGDKIDLIVRTGLQDARSYESSGAAKCGLRREMQRPLGRHPLQVRAVDLPSN